jgi:hypothetical protein
MCCDVMWYHVLCYVSGRGSSLYQMVGAFVIMIGAWIVLLPSSSSSSGSGSGMSSEGEEGHGGMGGGSLVFMSNMLYMASNIPIALRWVTDRLIDLLADWLTD